MRAVIVASAVSLLIACSSEGDADEGSTTGTRTTGGASATTGLSTTNGSSSSTDGAATGVATQGTDGTDSTDSGPATSTAGGGPCDPVVFADPGVEAGVRYELDLPVGPIPGDAVAAMEQLGTSARADVADLGGLECASSLERLAVYSGNVDDLTPIAGLTLMRTLTMNGHQLADFEKLEAMTQMRELRLQGNSIADVSPLASLTNTIEINLEDNMITDLGPLVGVVWQNGDGCGDLFLAGNPLSQQTLTNDLPQICAESGIAVWVDGVGSCPDNSCVMP